MTVAERCELCCLPFWFGALQKSFPFFVARFYSTFRSFIILQAGNENNDAMYGSLSQEHQLENHPPGEKK